MDSLQFHEEFFKLKVKLVISVLYVVEATSAGVGRHVIDLARGMSDAGNEVHVVWSDRRASDVFKSGIADLEARGAHTMVLPMTRQPSPADFICSARVSAYLKSHPQINVVHGHSSKGGGVARLITPSSRRALIYTPNAFASMDSSSNKLKRVMVNSVEYLLSLRSSSVICVSPEEVAFAKDVIGIDANKLVMIPNAISTPVLEEKLKLRAECGIDPNRPVVGFVGRLSRQKAPDRLMSALPKLLQHFPEVLVVFVGDGELKSNLHSLMQELNLSKSVIFLTHPNAQMLMPMFDVLCIPSRYEGLPYVALEALAAGLPLVVSPEANCSLFINADSERTNGSIVDTSDPNTLGDALSKFLGDPIRLSVAREQSIEISRQFGLQAMIEKTTEAYESALSNLRKRAH